MNLQEEILKIKNEMIDEFDKRVEALKEDEQEFPQDGDEYWYLDTTGDIYNENWECFSFEKATLEIGNVFKTKEQAEFAVEKLKVEAELRKFSRPFKRDSLNFLMCFDTEEDKLFSETRRFMVQGAFYFESILQLDEAIQSVGENRIKKYIFGVEDLIND